MCTGRHSLAQVRAEEVREGPDTRADFSVNSRRLDGRRNVPRNLKEVIAEKEEELEDEEGEIRNGR